MKIEVNYKLVNSEFSQERADEYNFGEPGPENMKYHETWRYDLDQIKSIMQIEDGETILTTIDSAGNKREFTIKNLFHLQCELEDGQLEDYFVSKSLIRNTHMTKTANGKARFYFYLKTGFTFVQEETVFFDESDLPEEFLNTEWVSAELPNKTKSTLAIRSGSFTPKH